MRFADPLVFLLLLLLPLVAWLHLRRRPGAVRYSDISPAKAAGKSLRQRLIHLPLILHLMALALLITALARPQFGMEKIKDINHGIAVEMVVDRSSSMGNPMAEGKDIDRLTTVKELFASFVNGNRDDLKGRPNDLIGMVSFARHARTVCPLTLAHGVLDRFLDDIHLVTERNEDGTAIGDALALAAARLKTAEESLKKRDKDGKRNYHIKSKVIILLTDGENNMGSRTPEEAARLAAKWGIKIYAIGVGGEEILKMRTFLGTQAFRTGREVDMAPLEKIAEITGGRAWRARDGAALAEVYKEIDKLEKSEVESVRYLSYKERFTPPALAALLLLAAEAFLNSTLFRRSP